MDTGTLDMNSQIYWKTKCTDKIVSNVYILASKIKWTKNLLKILWKIFFLMSSEDECHDSNAWIDKIKVMDLNTNITCNILF